MSLIIRVYSDFVCPYSFLSDKPLREVTEGTDIVVERLPFELKPPPQVTPRPEDEYLQRTWLLSVYPLARKMDVPIRLPRISPQPHTELAFEGFHFAKSRGKGDEYYQRVARAFFQEEKDIGKVAVLSRLVGEIGLEEKEFSKALEKREFRKVHQEALQKARSKDHILSTPTFVVGNQKLSGMQTRDSLGKAIARALEGRPLGGALPKVSTPVPETPRFLFRPNDKNL